MTIKKEINDLFEAKKKTKKIKKRHSLYLNESIVKDAIIYFESKGLNLSQGVEILLSTIQGINSAQKDEEKKKR